MAAHGADSGTGSARRRRKRRLRSWLRHEQQSIAAVLATVTHHSFDKVGTASGVLRNRKTAARTGREEEYETHYTAKFRKTPPPQAAATEYYPMTDDEGGEVSAGVRLAPLEEGRRASRIGTQASGTKSSRISMSLCRRWWNSFRIPFSSSPHSHLFPSRFSQCRRSCLTMFLRDVCVATRSWLNSWWKCRRS